jgi:hypothetical protein
MMARSWNERRHFRQTKGLRRLSEDRAQHGGRQTAPRFVLCECFSDEAAKGKGAAFARFADTPTPCSGNCCGNPRRHFGEVTVQEQKAPKVREEWD